MDQVIALLVGLLIGNLVYHLKAITPFPKRWRKW
jgi:hypothetical protein